MINRSIYLSKTAAPQCLVIRWDIEIIVYVVIDSAATWQQYGGGGGKTKPFKIHKKKTALC